MDNNFILDFIKKLVINKIDFVICGGIACILQGCERATLDLDIAISFDPENIENFINLIKNNTNLKPRIPEPIENLKNIEIRNKWIYEKNALVYTLISNDGIFQVDIFLNYPIDYNTLKSNADIFEIDGFEFRVSSKNDLILAKENIPNLRDKDLQDIKELKRLLNEKN